MSKKMFFYVALVLVTANLFYKESWGLNTLIVSLLTVLASLFSGHYDSHLETTKNAKWWFAALLFVSNGFAVFYNHTLLSCGFYLISFLYFSAIQAENKLSVPLGFAQSAQSFFGGFYYSIESMSKRKEKTEGKKRIVKLLLFTVPLVIAIVFLKLYQSADPTFYELTKFINLDWISWGFIGFYIVLFFAGYGLFYFRSNQHISSLETNLKNSISPDYGDGIQTYLGILNEQKIALSLLITLNLMLLLYNGIDLKFIIVDLPNPAPTLRYSALLHGGVNSLISSIVLVILIVTFIYRGQLNFTGNKTIRILALLWILLNLVMVATTVVKNAEYIAHWGLTYKRIGVYIYLLLAAVGLIFTLIKILKIKSIWFLIRNTSLAFLVCFTLMGFVNWDKLIVKYNLSELAPEQIDFYYLEDLGPDAYPDLIAYYNRHKNEKNIQENTALWHRLFLSFEATKQHLTEKQAALTWRSLNLREWNLLRRMQKFKLINFLTQNK